MTSSYLILEDIDVFIKLGRSKNPEQRLNNLSTGNYRRIEVLASTDKLSESKLHKRFAEERIKEGKASEWFKMSIFDVLKLSEEMKDGTIKVKVEEEDIPVPKELKELFEDSPDTQKEWIRWFIEKYTNGVFAYVLLFETTSLFLELKQSMEKGENDKLQKKFFYENEEIDETKLLPLIFRELDMLLNKIMRLKISAENNKILIKMKDEISKPLKCREILSFCNFKKIDNSVDISTSLFLKECYYQNDFGRNYLKDIWISYETMCDRHHLEPIKKELFRRWLSTFGSTKQSGTLVYFFTKI